MLVGLQGSGKTTSAGKLAVHLRKIGHQPLLAATDTRRPAAIQQLQTAGEQLGIPVAEVKPGQSPLEIARAGVAQARAQGRDTVVLDTQGRLHIDDELMGELVEMQREVSPTEVLLVLDAMTGQDAVQSATAFDEKLAVTGLILSKLDGDSRGGAALSARAVTGKPIKFAGVGEKAEALEPFHPDRMASRILGMGDVLTLIEKAGTAFDEAEAAKLEKKLRQNRFDLEDFLQQMQQVSKMGPLDQILDMVPGVAALRRRGPVEVDTGRIARMQAIIQSMTPEERHSPDMIHSSRKRRIAAGSGTDVQSVNQLLSQFRQMKTLFSQMEGMHKSGRTPGLPTFFNR
jgi:signal recognition particle subunit SRP54